MKVKQLREAVCPEGYYFGRNFKVANNQSIVDSVINEHRLEGVKTVRNAYKNNGEIAEHKFAVYFKDRDIESLFFQFYRLEKQKRKTKFKKIQYDASR